MVLYGLTDSNASFETHRIVFAKRIFLMWVDMPNLWYYALNSGYSANFYKFGGDRWVGKFAVPSKGWEYIIFFNNFRIRIG